jgi:hypothetical protein
MSMRIVKNFVIVFICALQCCISPIDIQRLIDRWKTSKWCGEIIKISISIYFADCYNDNPITFTDSLSQFDRLFPHVNRLFIIGFLRYDEMWIDIVKNNIRIFKNLPLCENDIIIVIGE